MGVKSKIEQAINRARREGRVEDVTKLQGNLAALKKQRGDAAWARANTYKVKPGDSFFSIAGSELGSERWVQQLLRANPGVNWLTPGMEILLPSADGDALSISQTDFDALKDYLDPWGKKNAQAQRQDQTTETSAAGSSGGQSGEENSSAPLDPQEDAIVSAAVAGLQQLQQTDPTLYNQFATLIGLPPLPPTSMPAADSARQAAFEAREARLAGGLPARKPAGSKVWRRPAKQGPTPPPYDPHLFPGLDEDKNFKYQQREAARNTAEDGDQGESKPLELTEETLQAISQIAIQGENRIDETARPSDAELLENIKLIIEAAEQYDLDTNQIAYILATAHLESDLGGNLDEKWPEGMTAEEYYIDLYWDNEVKRSELGNQYESDAHVYHGRGFAQLTGKGNYTFFSREFGVDLLNLPNLVYQDKELAAKILVFGMVNGTFTGMIIHPIDDYNLSVELMPEGERRMLSRYNFPDQFLEAREIIGSQGAERAARIAQGYACILQSLCESNQLPPTIRCANAGC